VIHLGCWLISDLSKQTGYFARGVQNDLIGWNRAQQIKFRSWRAGRTT
jgi:hypothetical protein